MEDCRRTGWEQPSVGHRVRYRTIPYRPAASAPARRHLWKPATCCRDWETIGSESLYAPTRSTDRLSTFRRERTGRRVLRSWSERPEKVFALLPSAAPRDQNP